MFPGSAIITGDATSSTVSILNYSSDAAPERR